MNATTFPLLDPADEDALHYSRLLTVEERPFLRLATRLRAQSSLISTFPRQLPSPPPENPNDGDIALDNSVEPAPTADYKRQELERRQWRQELVLEFATIENTLARIQLLNDSNERERTRYAEQKTRILESAQSVRSNTAELRVHLQEVQQTLALRKQYDELADKITVNKALRPRHEQHAAMEKLRGEIADLQQEGLDYASTWQERRGQFDRIVDESQRMMRMIRGEKDVGEEDDGDVNVDIDVDGEGPQTGFASPRGSLGHSTPIRATDRDDKTPASAEKSRLRQVRETAADVDMEGANAPGPDDANDEGDSDEGLVSESMDTT